MKNDKFVARREITIKVRLREDELIRLDERRLLLSRAEFIRGCVLGDEDINQFRIKSAILMLLSKLYLDFVENGISDEKLHRLVHALVAFERMVKAKL